MLLLVDQVAEAVIHRAQGGTPKSRKPSYTARTTRGGTGRQSRSMAYNPKVAVRILPRDQLEDPETWFSGPSAFSGPDVVYRPRLPTRWIATL